jgi:hypothetical protein
VRSRITAFGVHIHRGSLVTFPSLARLQLMEPDSAFATTPARHESTEIPPGLKPGRLVNTIKVIPLVVHVIED